MLVNNQICVTDKQQIQCFQVLTAEREKIDAMMDLTHLSDRGGTDY